MAARQVHLDFETQSALSVKDVGAWVYSRHPSTTILCAAFALGDSPVELLDYYDIRRWVNPEDRLIFGEDTIEKPNPWMFTLRNLAEDPTIIFAAHNALFEQCIWHNIMVKKLGMPPIPIERWRCTAAKAAAFSLPRDLEGVGLALDLPVKKDKEGHKIMMKLSRPRRASKGNPAEFWTPETAPEDFKKLYAYNITDVESERCVDKAVPPLNAREQKIWFMDQKINLRGIRLDIPTIQLILEFIDRSVEEMKAEFVQLTGGELDSPSQVAKLIKWCSENGLELPNLQAATIDKLLKSDTTIIPDNVRRVLEIRRSLSKISTSKYTAMLDRADYEDGCLRDILLYCAAITHRWGGRGVQPQNLPRGTVDSDVCVAIIQLADYLFFKGMYPDVMSAYSSCVRSGFIARPGCDLVVSDFSAIEARVLPWLAGQDSTLELFRRGEDVYCHSAGQTYGRIITKKDKYERSVGKVQELALGYQGGIGAFGTMARGYGVDLRPAYSAIWPAATTQEQEKARMSYNQYLGRCEKADELDPLDRASGYAADVIKQRWRISNPKVVQFWSDLEAAAIAAVLNPTEKHQVGGEDGQPVITFGMYKDYLLMKLPSGNCLVYPKPRVSENETPWGQKKLSLSYYTVDSVSYQYRRTWTYGGKLAENATQAVARELLADAMLRMENAKNLGYSCDYPVVLHVHDEAVSEVPEGVGSVEEHERIMTVSPDWAEGLPLKAEGWRGKRYKK